MIDAISTSQQCAENMRNTFTLAGVYAKGFFKGGITEPAAQAFQYLGSVAVAAWDVLKDLFSGKSVEASFSTLKSALAGSLVEESQAFKTMFADLDAERQKHAANTEKIEASLLAKLEANAKQRVANEILALDEISEAEQAAADAAADAAKERNAELKRLAEERVKTEEDIEKKLVEEREAAWKNEKERLEEELKLKEAAAAVVIKDVIAAAKAGEKANKAAAKDADREAKRAAVLEDRKRKGGRLDRKQAEFLAAFQDREAARKAIPGLKENLDVANQNLLAMQQQGITLNQMLAKLTQIDTHQRELLAQG
jgi:hypothetical protein